VSSLTKSIFTYQCGVRTKEKESISTYGMVTFYSDSFQSMYTYSIGCKKISVLSEHSSTLWCHYNKPKYYKHVIWPHLTSWKNQILRDRKQSFLQNHPWNPFMFVQYGSPLNFSLEAPLFHSSSMNTTDACLSCFQKSGICNLCVYI